MWQFYRNSFIVNCSCFVGDALECLNLPSQIFPLVRSPFFNWQPTNKRVQHRVPTAHHLYFISSSFWFGDRPSDPSRINCTWGSACTRAARRSSFSRHRASFIRINRAQEPGQTDVSSGASEELEKCWMISLFYFHKSATELALLGVNTGELSLSWSKNDPLARGQPFFP